MAETDHVVSLRFRETSVPDMELYERLTEEKTRRGVSMPACVKEILRQYFENSGNVSGGAGVGQCIDQIREAVRGEMAAQREEMVRAISEAAGSALYKVEEMHGKEGNLPGCSDELPEGLEAVLDKFM